MKNLSKKHLKQIYRRRNNFTMLSKHGTNATKRIEYGAGTQA